jgi:uncharacterized protein YejL (UPF0352 family)
MNRKQWKQQVVRRERADKAWEEAKETDQFVEELLVDWLKAGGMSPEEVSQLCEKVRREIIDVLDYHKVPVGLTRCILMSLMAQSLAQQATNTDWLAETAAQFGRVLVEHALEMYSMRVGQ